MGRSYKNDKIVFFEIVIYRSLCYKWIMKNISIGILGYNMSHFHQDVNQ